MDTRKHGKIDKTVDGQAGQKKDRAGVDGQGGTMKYEEVVEIVAKNKIYHRRQIPMESAGEKKITAEQLEQVRKLDEILKDISERVMTAGRSDKKKHEEFLEEIRANLTRIIKIDPSRYDTPLGEQLESALVKIYSVLGR